MLGLIWLIPVLPFAGFVLLTLMSGWHRSRRLTAIIGIGSVGLAAALAGLVAFSFVTMPPPDGVYVHTYWTWLRIGDFAPQIALHLDALSLLFILVITFVGFLIHLYSAEFMAGDVDVNDPDYTGFFSLVFVGTLTVGFDFLILH